jgi:membrane protein implicated in regulation of membrane protease activity
MAVDWNWWIALGFVVTGIIMLLVETAAPGFFIAVPGTVLIILGLIGMAVTDFLISFWSPIVALIVCVPTIILVMMAYQKLAPPAPPETTVGASLIGKMGIVTTDVEPNNIRGKVKIKNDYWSATAPVQIPVGRKVVVVMSEGVHVTVQEITE